MNQNQEQVLNQILDNCLNGKVESSTPDRYNIMVLDASYFLTRNFMAMKNGPDISVGNLFRSFYYTVVKYLRELHRCRKVILAWDKWDPIIKGYYRNAIIDQYKGDRHYASESDIDIIKADPDLTDAEKEQKIEEITREIRLSKIKTDTKYLIINELGKYGIPSILYTGYEADDLAKIISDTYDDPSEKYKCSIVSVDSDWSYLINPNVDFCNARNGVVMTHRDVLNKESNIPNDLGISLYQYKSILDSLYGSHNFMQPSVDKKSIKKIPIRTILESVLMGESKYLADNDLYLKNIKSFDFTQFSGYDNISSEMKNKISTLGSLSDPSEFKKCLDKINVNISDSYYSSFQSYIDPSCYVK